MIWRLFARVYDLLLREPSPSEPEEDRTLPSGEVVRRKIGDCPFFAEAGPAPRSTPYCHRRRQDGAFTCAYTDEDVAS